jgi:hypothetical protein
MEEAETRTSDSSLRVKDCLAARETSTICIRVCLQAYLKCCVYQGAFRRCLLEFRHGLLSQDRKIRM